MIARRYIADAWMNEVMWLGITISSSYAGEPECNGVIECFVRTREEQRTDLHLLQSLTEARRIIEAQVSAEVAFVDPLPYCIVLTLCANIIARFLLGIPAVHMTSIR
jgi:hypothetical protein